MLDESLLDDPAALRTRDRTAALLSLAVSGARVRTAVRLAAEAGLGDLSPDGRPRHLLLAGQGSAAAAADLARALAGTACPVTVLRPTGTGDPGTGDGTRLPGARWTLPAWAGPTDLLVLLSASPAEAGLTTLAHQAYRRGCALVVIARQDSAFQELAAELHAPLYPYAPPGPTEIAAVPAVPPGTPEPAEGPATLWGLLPPLLLLADRLHLLDAAPADLEAVADRLDTTAETCGPESPTYRNPAKALAAKLDGTLPLLWSNDTPTAAVADRFAAALADHSALPALAAPLPAALAAHRGLLAGAVRAESGTEDDFFRDRVEDPDPVRPHIVLLRSDPPATTTVLGDDGRVPEQPLALARILAEDYHAGLSDLAATPPGTPDPTAGPAGTPGEPPPEDLPATGPHPLLPTLAELIATLDFAAHYLDLATVRD